MAIIIYTYLKLDFAHTLAGASITRQSVPCSTTTSIGSDSVRTNVSTAISIEATLVDI